MVELALVLPLLVMLLVGIMNFGIVFNRQVSIQAAAREGARALALGESTAAAQQAVVDAAPSVTNLSFGPVVTCAAGSTATSTQYASITVHARYAFSIPFVHDFDMDLTATARMRCGL